MIFPKEITVYLSPHIAGKKTLVMDDAGASQFVWGGRINNTGDVLKLPAAKGVKGVSNIHITVPKLHGKMLADGTVESAKFHITFEVLHVGAIRYMVEESANGEFHKWCVPESSVLMDDKGKMSTYRQAPNNRKIPEKSIGRSAADMYAIAVKVAEAVTG